MERLLDMSIDRTVEPLMNHIELLQQAGRKEFQQTTRLRNQYTKIIEQAREQIHSEEKGKLLTDYDKLACYIHKLTTKDVYVLDIETTGLDPFNDPIVGICLYAEGMTPAYVPVLHTD